MSPGPEAALARLREAVAAHGALVVGFSGGVDSAVLADVAAEVLGDRALAVTAVSPSLAASEREGARAFATAQRIRHLEVLTDEGDRPDYVANAGDRCYHCKSALFDALEPLAVLSGARIALGTNLDDLGDHRPGLVAAGERAVVAPLVEAGLTKADVRAVAKHRSLAVAAKPAAACLASRVAYGDPVTPEVLARIDAAEAAVRAVGYPEHRVRAHGGGSVARIEVPADQMTRALADRDALRAAVLGAGFDFASLDLAGFATGSMNVVLRPRGDRPGAGPAPVADLGFARVDLDRERRQGLPEAVYAPGKAAAEVVGIVGALLAANTGPVLVTRIEPDDAEVVARAVPGAVHRAEARLLVWRPAPAGTFRLAVASAGTADGRVADELEAVATAVGLSVQCHRDVGVAGIHRLLAVADELGEADAVAVVAGMEGALASAVGGLVGVPVIAVPTSTGYGAALEGVTALLAMLTSCAAGLTVVNVDSGYGAAMAAFRLSQAMARPR